MSRSQSILFVLLITILSFSIYINTLKNGFVYDDELVIVNSTLIKNFNNLPMLFKKDYFALSRELSYRPVVTFTYFTDHALFGLNPLGYHLTNIFLHALNSILLYIFLKWYINKNLALMSTLLFLSHPMLTEAVNAIAFREDLLVFTFYFISLICYLNGDVNKRYRLVLYLGSWLSFFLALLSKEMAITLPLIIILFDLYRGADFRRPWRYIGFIIILLFYVYLRFFMFFNPMEQEIERAALSERLLQLPALLSQYFKLLLFPINLSIEYPGELRFDWMFVSCLIMLGIGLFMVTAEKAKCYLIGILWIFITLVPVYNIVPIDNPFAERYLYLPMPGFSIALASLLINQRRCYKTFVITPILAFFIILTIWRNPVWQDNYSLWKDAAKKVSTDRVYFRLGKAYFDTGKLNDAVNAYLKSLSIEPYDSDPYVNLGITYFTLGNIDSAIDSFKKSIWMKYDDAPVHYLLGRSYSSKGLIEEAKSEHEEALRIAPDFKPAKEELQRLSNL